MSKLVAIEGLSRREAIRRIALALTAAGAGALDYASAQEVHRHVAEERTASGDYKRKFLNEHEWATIKRLAELVVPADEKGGSAADAGAVEFIDLLCSQSERLQRIYTGGIAWQDALMRTRFGAEFVAASEAQQIEMLDTLVAAEEALRQDRDAQGDFSADAHYARFRDYGIAERSDLTAAVRFFDWARKMIVDAYYTSEIGIKDLGYVGNDALSEYKVPEGIFEQALRKSPFA